VTLVSNLLAGMRKILLHLNSQLYDHKLKTSKITG